MYICNIIDERQPNIIYSTGEGRTFMKIKEFKLERLFARYKAQAKYTFSQTACEFCTMQEILDMADDIGMLVMQTSLPMFQACGILYQNGLRGAKPKEDPNGL